MYGNVQLVFHSHGIVCGADGLPGHHLSVRFYYKRRFKYLRGLDDPDILPVRRLGRKVLPVHQLDCVLAGHAHHAGAVSLHVLIGPLKDLFGEVYRLTEKDSVRKGMFSKFLSRNRDEDRFLSYASAVLSSSLDGHLQGRAADLVREIRELEEKDALMIGKITALSGYLDDNKDSFQRTVKQGITDCRKNLEKLTAEEEEKFVSYGYFLYENGSTWVSESTPSEILDILQSILEEHDRYNALIDRREMLQRKERVDGVRALISEEEEKIRILEAEKARIDDEIAGIREEIAKLRIRLDGLSG